MPHPSAPPPVELSAAQRGFSLVELLVALVFTSILMAGMAKVFQSSLGTFVSASESISSGRRNRMAMDLLFDDLNVACMVPFHLTDYPTGDINPTNPPFRINPNVAYASTDVPAAQAKADQLDFYYDDILPFDATVGTKFVPTGQQVKDKGQLDDNASFIINFRDADQAANAASLFSTFGLSLLFRGSGATKTLASATQHGSSASVDATLKPGSYLTGTGADSNATVLNAVPSGSGVTLMRTGRYVRYSIKPKSLDPSNLTVLTPCLVREEATYATVAGSGTPFATPDESVVVAENVIGFKVLLSGDGGKTWAGGNTTDTTWADLTGPSSGAASPSLNWQLASGTAPARTGMNSTYSNVFWFREIPVLVRVDVTTRTVNKRTEYASVATASAYKTQTQSLILAPRHSGLAYQPLPL